MAGCVVPGSDVDVADVYDGPARLGYIDVLRRMGAAIDAQRRRPGDHDHPGHGRAAHGTEVHASEIPSLDEIPALAVAAAVASGTTVFSDVGELRVKEVDRLAAVADMVETFGAQAASTGTPCHHRRGGPAAAAVASTAGATTAWRCRPPWRPWRRAGGAQPAHRVRRRRDELPDLRRRPGAAGGRAPRRPGRCSWPLTGRPARASPPSPTAVAQQLGVERLDTGAMYRAVAALALALGIAPRGRRRRGGAGRGVDH